MRVLVVSPYPPVRDGIAAYAVQGVAALRRQGHDVEVLSPGPSAAHHHLALAGPRGALALAKRVRAYDKVVLQFHPDVFYPVPSSTRQRAATSAALLAMARASRELEVVLHEIDYRHGRGPAPDAVAARAFWHAVDRVVVHTEAERDDFVRAFGISRERVVVSAHGGDFAPRTRYDRGAARVSLGLPADTHVLLTIGFIQPHKGFDRAVAAFRGLAAHGAELHVVGSVRVEEPAYLAHLNELEAAVSATDGAHLHTGYVSDELFDRWLVAADTVVLPYRAIWSSGVLERAALYHRPVVATRVGGLAQQAGERPGVTLVDDDARLRDAMWAAAGVTRDVHRGRDWPVGDAPSVQDEVRRRAALDRGSASAAARPEAAVEVARQTAPLRRVAPLQLPPPTAHRSSTALVKRVVRRLTAWQLEPVVGQLNALRAATLESVERAAAEQSAAGRPLSPQAVAEEPHRP